LKKARKNFCPVRGWGEAGVSHVGSHMAETGLTPPAYGAKVFWLLFFKKVTASLFLLKNPDFPKAY
jgi:hypothetical protein